MKTLLSWSEDSTKKSKKMFRQIFRKNRTLFTHSFSKNCCIWTCLASSCLPCDKRWLCWPRFTEAHEHLVMSSCDEYISCTVASYIEICILLKIDCGTVSLYGCRHQQGSFPLGLKTSKAQDNDLNEDGETSFRTRLFHRCIVTQSIPSCLLAFSCRFWC